MSTPTLSTNAYLLFRNLLQAPGWAKELGDIYSAGKFLVEKPETAPTTNGEGYKFELSDKELECFKKALKFHVSAGNVPASVQIVELIDELKIQV